MPVGGDAAIWFMPRGGGLAEVMAEYGHRHEQVVRADAGADEREGVDGVERVGPDVAFGMPARVLFAVDERREFGVVAEPAAVAQEQEPEGGLAAQEQELLPFGGEALARQVVLRHRTADRDRFGRDGEAEARGELHGAQRAQRIFREVRADVAQDAGLDVGEAVEGVDELGREGVEEDGVDGEVAAGAGLVEGEVGHGVDEEAAMPGRGLAFAARQRDVHRDASELDDAEAGADLVEAERGGENGFEAFGREAVDLQVEFVRSEVQHGVADAAADEKRAAAGVVDAAGDVHRGIGARTGAEAAFKNGGGAFHLGVRPGWPSQREKWRRGRDLNPRYLAVHSISSAAPSATRSPLQKDAFAS